MLILQPVQTGCLYWI